MRDLKVTCPRSHGEDQGGDRSAGPWAARPAAPPGGRPEWFAVWFVRSPLTPAQTLGGESAVAVRAGSSLTVVAALGGTHAPPAPGHVNGAAQSLCAGWVHQEVYGGHAGDLRFRFTFSSCRTCFLGLQLIAVCFNKVFFAVMKSLPFVN